ncbi:hypothetical protein EVAR_96035_1 [Eumeta japonica]|uniref:Uncharacterized protein n=1 Tax=Eumeta variegata TaxID=151549 RepID=A0A4C1W848_EUMVA|nr:hypothetical protein EVAR_96035_1 [Eumeta japonica]
MGRRLTAPLVLMRNGTYIDKLKNAKLYESTRLHRNRQSSWETILEERADGIDRGTMTEINDRNEVEYLSIEFAIEHAQRCYISSRGQRVELAGYYRVVDDLTYSMLDEVLRQNSILGCTDPEIMREKTFFHTKYEHPYTNTYEQTVGFDIRLQSYERVRRALALELPAPPPDCNQVCLREAFGLNRLRSAATARAPPIRRRHENGSAQPVKYYTLTEYRRKAIASNRPANVSSGGLLSPSSLQLPNHHTPLSLPSIHSPLSVFNPRCRQRTIVSSEVGSAHERQGKWSKIVSDWYPRDGRRSRGRQMTRWEDDLKLTAKHHWRKVARDRTQWKMLEEAYAKRHAELRDIV